MPFYQQCYPNALKYGLNKNNGTRQPEMPRIPTGKGPTEPTLRPGKDLSEEELARGTIMPAEGPGAVQQKFGKESVRKITILRPTGNNQIAKTRVFEKSSASTRAASLSPEKASPKKTRKTIPVATLPTGIVNANLEDRFDALKTGNAGFNDAAFAADNNQGAFSHADFAIDEN
jgi:hypothetical protein